MDIFDPWRGVYKISGPVNLLSNVELTTSWTPPITSLWRIGQVYMTNVVIRYFNPGTFFITAAILFLGYTAQKQNGGSDENCAGIKVPINGLFSSIVYSNLTTI